MQEFLIVTGLVCMALGLRSSRMPWVRKMGAFSFLIATFFLFFYVFDNLWAGAFGALLWFFLPWVELLSRMRRVKLPMELRLQRQPIPNPSFFPNAREATHAMEEADFEHITDCSWEWDNTRQSFRLYWHPEERAVATLCLCEQSYAAFAFISITSQDSQGRIWRTTNFPFAPTLRCPPDVRWNHVPCHKNCFHQILADHRSYLAKKGIDLSQLRVPDPELAEQEIEREMHLQVKHNIAAGIIRCTGDGHFVYSKRGLLFLWVQFLKDMLRFC